MTNYNFLNWRTVCMRQYAQRWSWERPFSSWVPIQLEVWTVTTMREDIISVHNTLGEVSKLFAQFERAVRKVLQRALTNRCCWHNQDWEYCTQVSLSRNVRAINQNFDWCFPSLGFCSSFSCLKVYHLCPVGIQSQNFLWSHERFPSDSYHLLCTKKKKKVLSYFILLTS